MTQESDIRTQQRVTMDRMREHSRQWDDYSRTATLKEFEEHQRRIALKQHDTFEQVDTDLSPHVEVVRMVPWLAGAALGVAFFTGTALYVARSGAWQTPETVITFVQPVKNPRWVK